MIEHESPAPLTAEEIARAMDAVNFALVAFAVPDRFRPYIDGVIGASGGSLDWFEASDIEIAQRARNVTALGLKEKSLEKWTQRMRADFAEWARAYKTALVEDMPGGKREGVNYKSRYRIGALFQVAIEIDRRAQALPFYSRQPKRALRQASKVVYLEFRDRVDKPPTRKRFSQGRRTCDTFLKLIDTYVEKLCGQAIIEHKDLGELLRPIVLNLLGKCELLNNSLAHFSNSTQPQQTQEDSAGVWGDNLSTQNSGPEGGFVHSLSKESMDKETGPDRAPIGQDRDEFLADTFPAELDVGDPVTSWRSLPVTDKQRDLLLKAGAFNIPVTRGEASDKIAELPAGALSNFFSLEELRLNDPKGGRGPGKEKRFCCPIDGKTLTDDHRDLTVDIHTGEYFCHCCHARGVLREFLGDSSPARAFPQAGPQEQEPKSDKWRKWFEDAKPIVGTPGARYLEGRGVSPDLAQAAGVRYGRWWRKGEKKAEPFNAVIFEFKNIDGEVTAAQARAIQGPTKRTGGELSQGVFVTPGAWDSPRVAIVEAPIDALILYQCGLEAIALGGTAIQEWLPGALAGKDVAIATDNDEPDKHGRRAGDDCAARLASLLEGRAATWRLRPVGAKDFAELAELAGLDAVAEVVMSAMEYAQEVAQR